MLVAAAAGQREPGELPWLEHPVAVGERWAVVPRAVLAHALCAALFTDLVARVPSGAAYVAQRRAAGRRILLDHGAVRTVAWPVGGGVPPGAEQVARVLQPLGYRRTHTYPLPGLRMTGYSYTHQDHPDTIAQWFVSELHPDEFSAPFRAAVTRVLATTTDALDRRATDALQRLTDEGSLPAAEAMAVLPTLAACFGRRHDAPTVTDHELLRAESAEMAWIATEGTTFNHATDRVDDLDALVAGERLAGRPIKDTIEVSRSGRVRQTAHRAAEVARPLASDDGPPVVRSVPGSFFEFIERAPLPGTDPPRPDLAFDAANAQGIFAMTRTPSAP